MKAIEPPTFSVETRHSRRQAQAGRIHEWNARVALGEAVHTGLLIMNETGKPVEGGELVFLEAFERETGLEQCVDHRADRVGPGEVDDMLSWKVPVGVGAPRVILEGDAVIEVVVLNREIIVGKDVGDRMELAQVEEPPGFHRFIKCKVEPSANLVTLFFQ